MRSTDKCFQNTIYRFTEQNLWIYPSTAQHIYTHTFSRTCIFIEYFLIVLTMINVIYRYIYVNTCLHLARLTSFSEPIR